MAKVLVVSQSKFMVAILKKILGSEKQLQILESDEGGALGKMNEGAPDVVVFDVQKSLDEELLSKMGRGVPPGKLVVLCPDSDEGKAYCSRAIKAGLKAVRKPLKTEAIQLERLKHELLASIKGKGGSGGAVTAAEEKPAAKKPRGRHELIVLCTSTGGPGEIRRLVKMLPENLPAVVLVDLQIHTKFTRILMKKIMEDLGKTTKFSIGTAEDGAELTDGKILLTPEKSDIMVVKEGGKLLLHRQAPTGSGGASYDVLLGSVAEACGKDCIVVFLSGEGMDGIAGLDRIKQSGGRIIVQDPSCGCPSGEMAKNIIKHGNVDYVVKLEDIPGKLVEILERGDVVAEEKGEE